MKNLWIVLFLLFPFLISGQCNEATSLTFSTNQELEDFIENNPNCKSVFDIICVGSDISNLALLSHFDTIQQFTILGNNHINHLSFLDNIFINKSISLYSLDSLKSLSKFTAEQPESFLLSNCPLIDSILLTRSLYQSVFLDNTLLDVFTDGFDADNIHVFNNVKIHSSSLIKARHIDIESNPNYSSFSKIHDEFYLDTLDGLSIRKYDYFDTEGFPEGVYWKSFSASNIKNMKSEGFSNKFASFENLSISRNSNIKDLSNFDKIKVIQSIILDDLDSLISLDAIPVTDSIPFLTIKNNTMLQNIQGISKTNAINFISLHNNPELEICNISLICNALKIDPNTPKIDISGNKTTCFDIDAVIESCETSSTHDSNLTFEIYPNPASQYITIIADRSYLSIFRDSNGTTVKEFEIHPGNNTLDITNLSKGLYFMRTPNFEYKKVVIE